MIASSTLRTPEALADAGLVARERLPALEAVAARYAVALTPAVISLIDPQDPADPIARQYSPHEAELDPAPGETADPVGDETHSPVEGVVHRYPDRALLKLTHTCAVYCRFCFRREVVGPDGAGNLTGAALDAAMDYLAAHREIWEVIITGGDPLVLSPRRLTDAMTRLAKIEHIKVVRLHTRIPVVDPEAVTAELARALTCAGKAVYVALHANHPRELTPEARAACDRLVEAGLPMISQTVLLRGVNDDPAVLGALMRAFVETRIKPYYLHHPDFAPGTAHMRVDIETGQRLMRALRGHYSGLCQPTYILDIPGGYGKVPVGPAYLDGEGGEDLVLTDPWGGAHAYPPRA